MSIEKRKLANGQTAYRVRWRENGANKARNFDRKRDAERFDAETRRLRQMGELGTLTAGKTTLAEFGVEWATKYAKRHLEQRTIDSYATVWDKHVLPRLGGYSLAELSANPSLIEDFDAALANDGVGTSQRRRSLVILQGVMQRAVEWKRIRTNPVKVVKKPRQRRQRPHMIVQAEQIEQMRAWLLDQGRVADATLVCLLAYAGLRPSEALALSWDQIGQRTIRVDRAVDDLGNFKDTKNRRNRSVRILGPLADDLTALRRYRAEHNPDSNLLWPSIHNRPLTKEDYTNWSGRIFKRACAAADVTTTPYELRHTFVSMLIHEGRSPVEVAGQAGHAPTMTLDTYAHVYDDLDPAARVPAETRIIQARAAASGNGGDLVPSRYPHAPRRAALSLIHSDNVPAISHNFVEAEDDVSKTLVKWGSTVRVRPSAFSRTNRPDGEHLETWARVPGRYIYQPW